jgi:hypothetical protein
MLFFSDPKQLKILLLLFCSLALPLANADDDASDQTEQRTKIDQPSVVINKNAQALSGLKTMIVSSSQHQAEFEIAAKVVSVAPLLALRERYLVAQAELIGAKARLKLMSQNLNRQQDLFRHGVSAKRSVQEQEAQVSSERAQVEVSNVKLTAIANETRLNWGAKLAEWTLSEQTAQLSTFLTGQQHLLQITLPSSKPLAHNIVTVFVDPSGERSKAYSATLISRSTQADNALQGESYFFQTHDDQLRVGMKVSVWIPETTREQSGAVVPESALLWYMDQVYVYIKVDNETFARRLIRSYSSIQDGYFIPEGINTGEEIVITGGQILLSEELRGQIPDED